MSIQTLRDTLKEHGVAGAKTAIMRYGEGGSQVYKIGDREFTRPAGEDSAVSLQAILAEIQ